MSDPRTTWIHRSADQAAAALQAIIDRGGKVATFEAKRDEEPFGPDGITRPALKMTVTFDGKTWVGVREPETS